MATPRRRKIEVARTQKLSQACEILKSLGFAARQCNQVAGYSLLACLGLSPDKPWTTASAPLRGITPMIEFIHEQYKVRYAPNTRETIRDEAVKYFVEAGLLIRNPDDPKRPVNSGKTVYQIEPTALAMLQAYGTECWHEDLTGYLARRESIRGQLSRERRRSRLPVQLPSGELASLSPGGQNPLIKSVVEEFCPRWLPGGVILYIGDAENKSFHLQVEPLRRIGVEIQAPEKAPDVVVHDTKRNWLVLIEAVTTAGPVDGKRRSELKRLFSNSVAGLVFVTAFSTRAAMRSFLPLIAWESEVWVAEAPDHLIHFNGERFLGPYAYAMPNRDSQ